MATPIQKLVDEFLSALVPLDIKDVPPYSEWDKSRLDDYLGLPLLPLPLAVQLYLDGQDEFSHLEHDAIEAAVEKYFELPFGYKAALCVFTSNPCQVAFIKWDEDDEAAARAPLA